MIAEELVDGIRRLLAERRLSQRQIAREMGVSRGTVGKIAADKRPDYSRSRRAGANSLEPTGPPERCPDCGGKVYMPCLLCRARARRAAQSQHTARHWPRLEGLVGLELKEEHHRRYEQVCAERMLRADEADGEST